MTGIDPLGHVPGFVCVCALTVVSNGLREGIGGRIGAGCSVWERDHPP